MMFSPMNFGSLESYLAYRQGLYKNRNASIADKKLAKELWSTREVIRECIGIESDYLIDSDFFITLISFDVSFITSIKSQ